MNTYSAVCTGASQVVAPINTGRAVLVLQNQDASRPYWVGFGRLATRDAFSLKVYPQQEHTFTAPDCPTEAINVIGDAGLVVGVFEQ